MGKVYIIEGSFLNPKRFEEKEIKTIKWVPVNQKDYECSMVCDIQGCNELAKFKNDGAFKCDVHLWEAL